MRPARLTTSLNLQKLFRFPHKVCLLKPTTNNLLAIFMIVDLCQLESTINFLLEYLLSVSLRIFIPRNTVKWSYNKIYSTTKQWNPANCTEIEEKIHKHDSSNYITQKVKNYFGQQLPKAQRKYIVEYISSEFLQNSPQYSYFISEHIRSSFLTFFFWIELELFPWKIRLVTKSSSA